MSFWTGKRCSKNLFWRLFYRIVLFVSLIAPSMTVLAADLAKEEALNFVFIVDGRPWKPPVEILAELLETSSQDMGQKIIHLLSEKASLSHVVVQREMMEGRPSYFVSAIRLARIGEVSFRGLGPAQVQQIRANLRVRVGVPFVPEEAERDREIIRTKVGERGYFRAVVLSPEVTSTINGELKIVFPTSLNAPCRIAEVRIEPDETLFDYFSTPIELGSLCDRASLNEILERQKSRLLAEGYLSSELALTEMNVSEDGERGFVKIRYLRGPKTRIESVNRQTGVVSDLLSEFRDSITAYDVLSLSDDELRSEVRRSYVKLGYANASVMGPTRLTDPNGDSVVRFYVQPGAVVVVGDVRLLGDLPLPRSQVLERMELTPSLFQGSVPFVEEALPRYRDRLLGLLIEEGFSEARVLNPTVNYAMDGRSVDLVFRITLGVRSVLRDVTILGRPANFVLTSGFEERILQPGQPVNAAKLKALEDDVRLELINVGYAYARAQVSARNLPVSGEVRPVQVTVDLDAGPLVKIGKVYAEGDVFEKQDRIIRESGLVEGDIFTPDHLEQARMRILKHDLFETVVIEPLSTEGLEGKDSVLDLVIRVHAKRSYTLGLSPSYGTRNGYRFSVDFAKNNLNVRGLRLTSTLSVSQEKLQSAVLSNQRILGRKMTLGLMEPMLRLGDYVSPFDWNAVTGLEVSAQSLSDRYFETFESGLAWRPQVGKRTWALQLKFSHEWSKAIGQGTLPLEALERPTVKIHEFVLGAALDTRNSPEWPTQGVTLELMSNHARFGLLSDVQYDRYSLDAGYFVPIWNRLSAAFNAGGLKISDVVNSAQKSQTAPSSRRATLAGRSLVRGFPEASSAITPGPLLWLNFQAPEANTTLKCQPTLRAIGATNVLYAKSELRLRSPWFGESLGFASFLDTGAAFFTANEISALSESLSGQQGALDPGGTDTCALKSAQIVSDSPVDIRWPSFFQKYLDNSYVSTGFGLRYIISTFATLNVDLGFPIREPGEGLRGDQCVEPSAVGSTSRAPLCVKRRSTSKIFGLVPLPGAYHIGIGANF
ncbi:MAG: hypothetical protein RIR26_1312 [Pseudomonadota bacterium]